MDKKRKSAVDKIISQLKKLNCPLMVNASDMFIFQILFQPGPERLKLIEWILKEIEFSADLADTVSQPFEKKIEKMHSFFSFLGTCKDIDVIKGLSSRTKQILFWQALVDILWGKHSLDILSSQNTEASEDEAYHSCGRSAMDSMTLRDITEVQYMCMSLIIQSGSMKEIKEPQLFPKDLLQECELFPEEEFQKYQIPTLDEIVKKSKDLNEGYLERLEEFSFEEKEKCSKRWNDHWTHGKPFPFEEYKFDLFLPREELKSLHKKTNAALNDVHACATGGFTDAFNSLKTLTSRIESNYFYDSGPAFERAVSHVDSFCKCEKSLQTVKSSDEKINETLEEAKLKPSAQLLSNSLLKKSIEILNSS
ncbi:uncharacterized protein LOC129234583 [Uloborus diversus]|uniref:uncharacterized protein LOC129234583 n=1 Tax=Uloborus diversus TaxID=327109 RepID=UPI00240A3E9F|nr:uncharacterized protein LOC129234583 [Uloborus diversus]